MYEQYDLIVVGCGFTGAVVARKLAEQNKKILIIDKRDHIAGNMYDYLNKHEILIQKYGIHTFHTNNEEVYKFVSKFAKWDKYKMTCVANIKNKYTDVPFNFRCIDLFYSKTEGNNLKIKLKKEFKNKTRVPVFDLISSNDKDIKQFGKFLFDNDYRPYTCKQWGRNPEDIDISILKRVQVALSYDNSYFEDKYQIMPKGGYTKLFKNIINHKNIDVKLKIDSKDVFKIVNNRIKIINCKKDIPVLYTGALDYLLDFKYGLLPYRTLVFKSKTYNKKRALKAPLVALPMHKIMTRMTEMKYITGIGPVTKTTIIYEYSHEYSKKYKDPYYPVLSKESAKIYLKYLNDVRKISNLYIGGRLADFKYYNMDDTIANAFKLTNRIS